MWLFNPSDPHSTPTGVDGLFGTHNNTFNVNVPPYWRLKYRPIATPTGPQLFPYDVLLGFDYANFAEGGSAENGLYTWRTAFDGERYDSVWAGPVPLIESVDDTAYDDILIHYIFTGGVHDYRDWRLHVTSKGWFLRENNPDEYGTGHDAVYLLEHRELGGPANIIGEDMHCHFDGLGENKFIYLYDVFPGSFGENESHVVYDWRPNIIIEPFWP